MNVRLHETSHFKLKYKIKSPYSTCMYIRLSQKKYFYHEISTVDAFYIPVTLTYPISVIIYCVSEDFLTMIKIKRHLK